MRMLRGCPECGATWREPTARFCGACGARLIERTDDTPSRLRRIHLPTATHRSRILVGLVVIAMVAAALTWAASRPPQIQEIDVAVPGPTELQEPPDRQDDLPRCVVDGLEQDCVTWQLDARIAGVQQHGKLLVVLRQHGMVEAVNPATGEIVWSTGTPIANGSLFGAPVPGRIIVMGEAELVMLDAGSGQTLGSWEGWIGAWSDEQFTVVGAFDVREPGDAPPTLVVDVISGQADVWELDANEHIYHLGRPIVSAVTNDNPNTNELRAYAEDGTLLWSEVGENWPSAVGDFVYTVALVDVGRAAEVRALDPVTGQVMWTSGTYESLWSTPALIDGRLVFQADNQLMALDPTTGQEQWKVPAPNGFTTFGHDPRLPGQILVSVWSDAGSSHLVGLDAESGEPLWKGPSHENEHWDASRITDDGLLAASGRRFGIHHWDGTVTSFELTAPFNSRSPRIVSLDPLVVTSGLRLYGIDADIALSGEPKPRESE